MGAHKIKFWHDEETDIFYLSLSDAPALDSEEVQEGVRVEYGPRGEIVGIEIHRISRILADSIARRLQEMGQRTEFLEEKRA